MALPSGLDLLIAGYCCVPFSYTVPSRFVVPLSSFTSWTKCPCGSNLIPRCYPLLARPFRGGEPYASPQQSDIADCMRTCRACLFAVGDCSSQQEMLMFETDTPVHDRRRFDVEGVQNAATYFVIHHYRCDRCRQPWAHYRLPSPSSLVPYDVSLRLSVYSIPEAKLVSCCERHLRFRAVPTDPRLLIVDGKHDSAAVDLTPSRLPIATNALVSLPYRSVYIHARLPSVTDGPIRCECARTGVDCWLHHLLRDEDAALVMCEACRIPRFGWLLPTDVVQHPTLACTCPSPLLLDPVSPAAAARRHHPPLPRTPGDLLGSRDLPTGSHNRPDLDVRPTPTTATATLVRHNPQATRKACVPCSLGFIPLLSQLLAPL